MLCLGHQNFAVRLLSCDPATNAWEDRPVQSDNLSFPLSVRLNDIRYCVGGPIQATLVQCQTNSFPSDLLWYDRSAAPTPVWSSTLGYDRAAAVNFARQYSLKGPGSSWRGKDNEPYDPALSNDCTVFISTALLEGGLQKGAEWNNTAGKKLFVIDLVGSSAFAQVSPNYQ